MHMPAAIRREPPATIDAGPAADPACPPPCFAPDADGDPAISQAQPLFEACALTVADGWPSWELDLTLHPGEGVCICGAGVPTRTRLLRAICGLERPARGEVCWKGASLPSAARLLHAELAYLGLHGGLKPTLTPRENLRFHLRVRACCARIDLAAALATVGLGDVIDTPCWRLSAIQNRLVEFARLLTTRATIWVLEEPLHALDTTHAAIVARLIADHLRGRGAAIIASDRPIHAAGVRIRRLPPDTGSA
jgi:heme exporter protein A